MLDKDAHFGVVAEASILLIKAEMRWMQMDYQGRRLPLEFLEDM